MDFFPFHLHSSSLNDLSNQYRNHSFIGNVNETKHTCGLHYKRVMIVIEEHILDTNAGKQLS